MPLFNKRLPVKIEPEISLREMGKLAEALTMLASRQDSYRFTLPGAGYIPFAGYEQGSYDKLYELYVGKESSGFQLGALFAQPIVKYYTAFTIGKLPHVVVRQRASLGSGATQNNKIIELTQFANQFLSDQHTRLIRLSATSNLYGDSYALLGFDRNIEVIAPHPDVVSPGFTLFSHRLANFSHRIKKVIQTADENKMEVEIQRYYDDQQLIIQIEASETSGALKQVITKPVIKAPNTFGKCPVVHLANQFIDGNTFGWSEFYPALPFMKIYHDTIVAGYSAQQYHGKPILQIVGITSNIKTWLKKTFGIDLDTAAPSSLTNTMIDFFTRHKFFAFSEGAHGEFIESKYPIGATEEIAKIAFQGLVRVCMIPEFLFGTAIESANASVREQYVGLNNRIRVKQKDFSEVLRQLIKQAFYMYSTVAIDNETGLPLDTYGFISDPQELEQFQIDIIWPPILNSDEQVKLDTLQLLQSMNALSFRTAYETWPEYIPDPDEELNRIREEFGDDSLPPKIKSGGSGTPGSSVPNGRNPADQKTNRQSQAKRDNKGIPSDNSGGTRGGK